MKFKYPLYKYDLKQDVSVADVDDTTACSPLFILFCWFLNDLT